MSFLNALQAVEAEYESVVYAPDDTVKHLREIFYSERISENPSPRNNEKHASKQAIAAVVEFIRSIYSQNYTARELMEMIEKRPDLTYQVTPPRIRHLMLAYDLPYKRVAPIVPQNKNVKRMS